jgi:integrase
MQRADIRDPRKTAHNLRHTVVTNLIRHGVAPTRIMNVTRHQSLDTLLAYAHEVAREQDPAEGYVGYENP